MNTKSRIVMPATMLGANGADYKRTQHHAIVPYNFTVEDILRPGFWAHQVGKLRKGDLIDIVSEDDSLDMTVRVVDLGIGMAEVRPLRVWQREASKALPQEEEPDLSTEDIPDNYKVDFAPGGGHLHRVHMMDPPMMVSKGHKSKARAIAAAIEHSKRANAA